MATVGYATLQVIPSMKGIGSKISNQLGTPFGKAGKNAGKEFGDQAGREASRAAKTSEAGLTHGFVGVGGRVGKKFGATFRAGMSAPLKGVAAVAAGAFAVDKAKDFFKGALSEARESQKVGAQTTAVIKATGGAANVSAKQIGNLATAISNKTGIDDEAIQSGANMLLTFKNIRNEAGKGNDIFNQSTSVLTDLATAMGSDPKNAAIQLGKALNDPVKGVTALQRVGVTFTDKQKKVIKSLVDSGKTMDAQKIILKELNSEFGGSAEAQATAGEKMSVAWGNFKENIGTALIPVIDSLENALSSHLIPALNSTVSWLQEHVPPAVAAVRRELTPLAHWLQGNIPAAFRATVKALAPFVSSIRDNIPQIKAFLAVLASNALALARNLFEALAPTVSRLGKFLATSVVPAVLRLGRTLIATVIPALAAAANYVKENQTLFKALLVALLAGIAAWKLYQTIVGISKAITAGIKAMTVAQKAFNAAMKANAIGIIVTALIALAAGFIYAYKHSETFRNIVNGALNAVKGVGLSIATFFAKTLPGAFVTAFNAVKNFFTHKLPNFITGTAWPFLKRWGVLLAGAIFPIAIIPGLIIAYWKPIKGFFSSVGGKIKGFFTGAGKWLASAGRSILNGLWTGIKFIWDYSIYGFLFNRRKAILGFFSNAARWLIDKGKDIFHGLQNGLTELWNREVNGWKNIGSRIAGWFSGAARWLVEKGKDVFRGLVTGLKWIWDHSVYGWIFNRRQAILNAIGNVAKLLWDKGKNIISGLWNGMKAALKKPYDWVKDNIFDPIKNAIKDLFGIHSPSTVMHELGGHVTNGFIKGMLSKNPLDVARGIYGGLGTVLRSLVESGAIEAAELSKKGLDALKGAGWSAPASGLGKQFGIGRFGGHDVEGQGSFSGSKLQGAAQAMLQKYGWGQDQWRSFNSLEMGEAGWNPNAQNPTSTAYGLGQFLDSTWAGVGGSKTSDPLKQLDYMMRYIKQSYGSPDIAYISWLQRNPHWYARGTDGAAPGWAVVGEQGPELINLRGREQILNARDTRGALSGMRGYASGTTKLQATAADFATKFREALPVNAMKFQVQAVANNIKAQIDKAFKGDKASFLRTWIDRAANAAIADGKVRMATVGKSLIENTVDYIDGGNALDKMGERFGRIYDTVRDQFSGPREKSILGYVRGFNDKLASLARQRDRIATQIDTANSFFTDQKSSATDFASLGSLSDTTSVSGIISGFESKLADIKNFDKNLKTLGRRHMSQGLLNQLFAMGPDQGGTIAAVLVKASGGSIARINRLNKSIGTASGVLARGETNSQFGGSFAKDFVAGLRSKSSGLESLMDRLGRTLATSLRRSFGLKGYAGGGHIPAGQLGIVGEEGIEIARGPMSITPHRKSMGLLGGGVTADDVAQIVAHYAGSTQVRVFIGDEEITDRIDQRVDAAMDDQASLIRNGRVS